LRKRARGGKKQRNEEGRAKRKERKAKGQETQRSGGQEGEKGKWNKKARARRQGCKSRQEQAR
jgi:hypothetical protein